LTLLKIIKNIIVIYRNRFVENYFTGWIADYS